MAPNRSIEIGARDSPEGADWIHCQIHWSTIPMADRASLPAKNRRIGGWRRANGRLIRAIVGRVSQARMIGFLQARYESAPSPDWRRWCASERSGVELGHQFHARSMESRRIQFHRVPPCRAPLHNLASTHGNHLIRKCPMIHASIDNTQDCLYPK